MQPVTRLDKEKYTTQIGSFYPSGLLIYYRNYCLLQLETKFLFSVTKISLFKEFRAILPCINKWKAGAENPRAVVAGWSVQYSSIFCFERGYVCQLIAFNLPLCNLCSLERQVTPFKMGRNISLQEVHWIGLPPKMRSRQTCESIAKLENVWPHCSKTKHWFEENIL